MASARGSRSLPKGFEDLTGFVDEWALPRETERTRKRCSSKMPEIKAFYDAMIERVDAALDHLDTFDLEALPEKEGRLFYLTLSLVEVANAVEFYNRPTSRFAMAADRFPLTSGA